jgi:hypothetical protein
VQQSPYLGYNMFPLAMFDVWSQTWATELGFVNQIVGMSNLMGSILS